jgi:hypothetical protein
MQGRTGHASIFTRSLRQTATANPASFAQKTVIASPKKNRFWLRRRPIGKKTAAKRAAPFYPPPPIGSPANNGEATAKR